MQEQQTVTLRGIIRGRQVELENESGLADGSFVRVTLRQEIHEDKSPDQRRYGAGALADSWTEEDDRILEEIYQRRKQNFGRELPE